MKKRIALICCSVLMATSTFAQGCEVSPFDWLLISGKILQRSIQDMFPISAKDEMEIGAEQNKSQKESLNIVESDMRQKRIRRIMNRLLPNRERQDIEYKIFFVNEDVVNAFSHAGGYLYIYGGLLDDIKNDDELALVIGHEISHVDKKHCIRPIQELLAAQQIASDYGVIASQLGQIATQSFGQYDEYEADWASAELCAKAGFDPRKGMALFERWAQHENADDMWDKMTRTHPFSKERVCYLEEYITQNIDK